MMLPLLLTVSLGQSADPGARIKATGEVGIETPASGAPWSRDGFHAAGARELLPLPGDRMRLHYHLGAIDPSRQGDAGQLPYRDRFLIDQLAARFPEADVAIVDRHTSRTTAGGVSVKTERVLEATARRGTIDDLTRLIDRWVEANQHQVLLECHVLTADSATSTDDVVVTVLDETAYRSVLTQAMESNVDLLAVPKVIAMGASRAEVTAVDQVTYVADFDVEVAKEAIVANPVIETLHEGLSLQITPIVGEAGELHLDVDLAVAELKRPIAKFETSLGKDMAPVTIELPELSRVHWRSSDVQLSPGDHAFRVRGLHYVEWDEDGSARRRAVELILHARVLDDDADTADLGEVIGYDADSRRVFIRVEQDGQATQVNANTITIERDGRVVGVGILEEAGGTILVVRLTEGAARKGDVAR